MEIRRQSFAGLLTKDPPEAVREKLVRWGVVDYVSIFSRAIGMNAVFVEPPAMEALNEEFLRSYHRYPDYLYRCYMESEPHQSLPSVFPIRVVRVGRILAIVGDGVERRLGELGLPYWSGSKWRSR